MIRPQVTAETSSVMILLQIWDIAGPTDALRDRLFWLNEGEPGGERDVPGGEQRRESKHFGRLSGDKQFVLIDPREPATPTPRTHCGYRVRHRQTGRHTKPKDI